MPNPCLWRARLCFFSLQRLQDGNPNSYSGIVVTIVNICLRWWWCGGLFRNSKSDPLTGHDHDHDPTSQAGSEGVRSKTRGSSRVRPGGDRKCHGPARVESGGLQVSRGGLQVSRIGSGQEVIKNVMGQLGSSHETFKSHGSGWVGSPCSDATRPARLDPTREIPCSKRPAGLLSFVGVVTCRNSHSHRMKIQEKKEPGVCAVVGGGASLTRRR